jgi:hypothetical protein
MKKATLVLAGVGLACTFAAQAAKPELTGQEKKAMAAAMAAKMKHAPAQPRTMAQSDAAKIKHTGTGSQGQMVATELWSQMEVRTDAEGNVHVIETDGDASSAATATEGLPNE